MKGIIEFFKQYFSSENKINEHIVMGSVFAVVTIVCFFVKVPSEVLFTSAGLTAGFFGISLAK